MSDHLVVFSPHHDDAYWQAAGTTRLFQSAGWRVTYITVIGEHYGWGGGREEYRRKAAEAARSFGVGHVQCEFKSMSVGGPDATWGERFAELMRDLQPTIAVTDYPVATHPDHLASAINSLRVLLHEWYGPPRQMPGEVWCYQAYNAFPTYDIAVDVSEWRQDIRTALWGFDEFGVGEQNALWQGRVRSGFREQFLIAKPDPQCVTRAFGLFPGKVTACGPKIPGNLFF